MFMHSSSCNYVIMTRGIDAVQMMSVKGYKLPLLGGAEMVTRGFKVDLAAGDHCSLPTSNCKCHVWIVDVFTVAITTKVA